MEKVINKTLSEIYDVVDYYRSKYKSNPIMIFLSHNLLELIKYKGFSGAVYEPLSNTRTLFGIECRESPVLTDLEYKIY